MSVRKWAGLFLREGRRSSKNRGIFNKLWEQKAYGGLTAPCNRRRFAHPIPFGFGHAFSMENSVSTPENPDQFDLRMAILSLSARGKVALLLVLPISAILLAIAWRILMG